ncbi:hypothetical protein THAOC_35274, partial [Thalassiosira oceanica]
TLAPAGGHAAAVARRAPEEASASSAADLADASDAHNSLLATVLLSAKDTYDQGARPSYKLAKYSLGRPPRPRLSVLARQFVSRPGTSREAITAKLMSRCIPVAAAEACANCGKPEGDGIELKNCTACRLVKYCGVDCQRAHRKKHKKACKQRVAELKDEQLCSQGLERPEGDFCPICTLPIPLPMEDHSVFKACCMKQICLGCALAAQKRGMFDCAFCRTPLSDNDADTMAMVRARVAKKDPQAILFLGNKYFFGELGLQKDMRKAVELWTKAAELGSIGALFELGNAYDNGDGVEEDNAKAAQFWTKAAIQGHVLARTNLGNHEGRKGNNDRAVRHYLISAKMGDERSLEFIKILFHGGLATKEQYAEALKGHQEAVEEMKSHDRDEAKAFLDNRKRGYIVDRPERSTKLGGRKCDRASPTERRGSPGGLRFWRLRGSARVGNSGRFSIVTQRGANPARVEGCGSIEHDKAGLEHPSKLILDDDISTKNSVHGRGVSRTPIGRQGKFNDSLSSWTHNDSNLRQTEHKVDCCMRVRPFLPSPSLVSVR